MVTLDRLALRARLLDLIEEAMHGEVEANVFQPRTVGDTKTLVLSWRPPAPEPPVRRGPGRPRTRVE